MKIFLGENIKKLRKEKKMTQEKLGELLNVSAVGVSKWENNETYPDLNLLFPLATLFGVSLDELFGYDALKNEAELKNAKK